MEGYETKTIKKALEAQQVRQEEIQDQMEGIEKQLRTLFVKRALMEVSRDLYVPEQERGINLQIKRLHSHLFNLNAQLQGYSLAIEELEGELNEREG